VIYNITRIGNRYAVEHRHGVSQVCKDSNVEFFCWLRIILHERLSQCSLPLHKQLASKCSRRYRVFGEQLIGVAYFLDGVISHAIQLTRYFFVSGISECHHKVHRESAYY